MSPRRLTGRRSSPARARPSSPGPASSTATTSSSSTASGSTPSSPTSSGSAPARSPVGKALVKSKLAYLAATPEIKGMHQKALLTASVFGLPMFAINMTGTPRHHPARRLARSTPNDTLGVTSGDLDLTDAHFRSRRPPRRPRWDDATSRGRDGVASNPGEPALPRYVANVDVPDKVLRGVGFRGGVFTETSPVKPFIGAPGTEFGGAQTPFTSTTFYPGPDVGGELLRRAQRRRDEPRRDPGAASGRSTSVTRRRSGGSTPSLDLRLFYADADDATRCARDGADDLGRQGDAGRARP